MKIKYVGFDKDGTLIDSVDAYTREWGKIIHAQFGIDRKIAERIFRVDAAGKPTAVQLALVLESNHIKLSEEEIFQKANEIASLLGNTVKAPLFSEVLDVLKKLKLPGFLIFISSGQQEEVVRKDLIRTNLLQYVDFYAGIKPAQPNFKKGEQHFRAAAKHFGVDFKTFVKETVFIGDTPEDIEVARNANILFIARVGQGSLKKLKKLGAKIVVSDFTNLPEIISTL